MRVSQMMHTLFLVTVGGALAKLRESASCVPLQGVAVQGPILKSLAGVSNFDVCCDECSHDTNCSAFTIHDTVCELRKSMTVVPSANVTSGIIKAFPPPSPPMCDYLSPDFWSKVGTNEEAVRQATVLDWQGKGLNDDDCKAIACLISKGALASLTVLHLELNQIGDAGMIAFSEALKPNSNFPMGGRCIL